MTESNRICKKPNRISRRMLATTRSFVRALRSACPVAVAGSAALFLRGIDLGRPIGDLDIAIFGEATPALIGTALKATGDGSVRLLSSARDEDTRMPIEYKGVVLDLLLPAQMARHASSFRREAADRLVRDTLQSVSMIDGLPVIGAMFVLAWKVLMSAGDNEGKHFADLNFINHNSRICIDDKILLTHIEANAGAHSRQYKETTAILFPADPWWSNYT